MSDFITETLDAGAAINGVDQCPHPDDCRRYYRECVAVGERPCTNAPSNRRALSQRERRITGERPDG